MTSTTTAVPPLIPGSANLATLQITKAKIFEIFGDINDKVGSVKTVVLAASTANLTLSGEQTVDTVALVSGDTILVKDQTTGSENGLYIVSTGAWSRTDNMPNGGSASGATVYVAGGATLAQSFWVCSNVPGSDIIGTDTITFTYISGLGANAGGVDTQVQYNDTGVLGGDAGLTYIQGTTTLNATNVTSTGTVTATNVAFGTAPTDLHGFYGTAAIARPAVSTADTTFVANGSGITNGTATYLGYTVEGIVTNLQALGLLS